jgi:hypothetical protein
MNLRTILCITAATVSGFLLLIVPTSASPVDVTYSVSGSAGNWTLDFSVTDNLPGTNDIYYFGIMLPAQEITGTPPGWIQPNNSTQSWFNNGGSSNNYNNLWIQNLGSPISPGQTFSGFMAVDSDLTLPSGVSWFAVVDGGTYPAPGPGCSFNCNAPYDNTGFEGLATAAPSAAPLPAALPLFATGLGAMGLFGWRRKRKNTAAVAA